MVAAVAVAGLGLSACADEEPRTAGEVPGVRTYADLSQEHTDGTVGYGQTPPVGGPHNGVPQACGIYAEPVASENAVHSLEHGAVWITYQPTLPARQLTQLEELVSGEEHRLLSPYPGLPAPVVASAWGLQLTVESADDPRLRDFADAYTEGPQNPEPGAACEGVGDPS